MPYSSDAKNLLKYAGIDIYKRAFTSPISLRKIGKRLGLGYEKVSFTKNTCGMLVRSKVGTYIFINEDHPYTRRRFSTAHEIGHYIFGHDSDVSRANDQNRREEVQANKFGSCLLMPDELFYYVHKEHRTIKEMAHWLRVSQVAVAIRCMQMGFRRTEAELVRSDYYDAISETVATFVRPVRTESDQRMPQRFEQYEAMLQQKRMNEVRSHNQAMIDRYRYFFGYD